MISELIQFHKSIYIPKNITSVKEDADVRVPKLSMFIVITEVSDVINSGLDGILSIVQVAEVKSLWTINDSAINFVVQIS